MTTINLKLGYFIESKKLSCNLKKKYIGKDKSGNPKEAVKTVGYFGNMEQAVSLAVHGLDKVLSEVKL